MLLGVILAIGLGMVFAAPAAQAETAKTPPTLQRDFTSSTSGKPVARITAEMKFDDASTNGTVTGNCGAAWIEISGALSDSGVMFSPYYQATTTATSPRPSGLALVLSGGVTLLSGSGCVLLTPTAFLPIS